MLISNSFTLSHSFLNVKYFFEVFYFFKIQNFKRRRRDLNPRAAINDLLPFQGSPFGQLGYFSKLPYLLSSSDIYLYRSQRQVILYLVSFMLSSTFLTFFKSFFIMYLTSGESGIRTHAPLRTNGFQDRLVMTTSIPLHMFSVKQNTGIFCILSSLLFIGKNVFKLCCCGTLCLFRCLCSSAVQKLL